MTPKCHTLKMSLTTFVFHPIGGAMARVSTDAALTAVSDVLKANGGKMQYAALVEALNSAGKAQYVAQLPQLKAQGLIVSSMEFPTPESSRAVSYVTVSGGVA